MSRVSSLVFLLVCRTAERKKFFDKFSDDIEICYYTSNEIRSLREDEKKKETHFDSICFI